MNNLYTVKDIIDENKNGEFLAICENGNFYECKFIAKNRALISSIPQNEKVIGYGKIIGRF